MKSAEHPVVSVIIPTYNSSQTLARAIDSVLRQTYHYWELIIVDDGSIDHPENVVAAYQHDQRIIFIRQENKGPGAARNTGASHARGTYLAFLDADDYWHDEKLARQIDIFNQDPKTIVCYTEVYVIDPFSDLIWDLKRATLQKPRSGSIAFFLVFHNTVTLSSTVVVKSVFDSIGGFYESRDILMNEDLDLWLRLAPMGHFHAITVPLTFYQLRAGITRSQIRENHKKIALIFKRRRLDVSGLNLIWYTVGWLRATVLYFATSMKILHTVRKIGVLGFLQELLRRFYLQIDFLAYPLLKYRLKNVTSITIDDWCDFAYRKSLQLLIPGQVESEIKTFLELAQKIHPQNILEIGTAHGGNLFLLTKIGGTTGKIISIDLPDGDYGGGYFARKQYLYRAFTSADQKMSLIRGDSHASISLAQVTDILNQEKLDILFIDADHSYEGVKKDFEMYSPLVRKGGIIAFHDIANDPDATYGVHKFWNEIKNNYQYQEIIDDPRRIGYGIGVIFF